MDKKRYKEEYEEGSELLWPSEKRIRLLESIIENYPTYQKNTTTGKNKKFSLIKQIIRIVWGQGGSPNSQN